MGYKKIQIIFYYILLNFFLVVNASAESENECFENVSRGIFKFNKGFDNLVLEPVAKVYNKLPEPVRNGTGNFTSNIATLLSIPNHLLQGELRLAGHATGSFVINSTIGVLGLGNPAAALGLENQKEDLGQTLGSYGIGGGCYFVLPILGPTTVRDTFGMVIDNNYLDPFARVTWHEKEINNLSGSKLDYVGVQAASAVDFRGDNMLNFESLEKNSIDLYAATKSLYLQDRTKKIKNKSDSDDDSWGDLDN
jgi:phospholipid-binding lipoprotein MlaA